MNDNRTLHATLGTLALAASLMAPQAHAAPTPSQDTSAFADGWRPARVEALLEGQAPAQGHIHKDCRSNATTKAGHVHASYAFGGNPKLRRQIVVPVNDAEGLKVGDSIRVNVRECLPAVR